MALFTNGLAATVGTTEQTIYTAPSGATGVHLVVGALATNILGSAIPINFKMIRGADTIHLAHNRRVLPNDTIDLLMGTKITLEAGDLLKISAPVDNAFSAILTVTEEVLG
jgi:hypothetical protein